MSNINISEIIVNNEWVFSVITVEKKETTVFNIQLIYIIFERQKKIPDRSCCLVERLTNTAKFNQPGQRPLVLP